MAVTQLARKGRVNKARSAKRKQSLKLLTAKPVIKNIDVEAIKAGFEAKKGTAKASSKKKAEDVPTASAE